MRTPFPEVLKMKYNVSASRSVAWNISLRLTGLELDLFGRRHGHKATQPLRLPLFFVDLRSQLVSLPTQSFCVGFESHKFVSPEVRFRHQKVEASRETTNLCLKIISCINKRGGTLANRKLNELLGNRKLGRALGASQGTDAL